MVGSGGLLGSALRRGLQEDGTELFTPAQRFSWTDEARLCEQIGAASSAFAASLDGAQAWEIYWAAGIGAMSSTEVELAMETRALTGLLSHISADARFADKVGRFAFASSAGAIYAGTSAVVITEATLPAPTTAYAREKLKQEELVRSFALGSGKCTALIAQISTLYGVGQAHGKKQGLLAHIARCILRNQVVHIYVPLDTIRDYIISDDAAAVMVGVLRKACAEVRTVTKIVASEQPTTISEIISVFRKVARHPPRIATSASTLSSLYSHCVRFRSDVLREVGPKHRTGLLVGVAKVLAAERLDLAKGQK